MSSETSKRAREENEVPALETKEVDVVEKKQKCTDERMNWSRTQWVDHFKVTLAPNYNKSDPNQCARFKDLETGRMRHWENISIMKLRLEIEKPKVVTKDSKKKYFINIINDLSTTDKVLNILGPCLMALWPKCGLTGDFGIGTYGKKAIVDSSYTFGGSFASWSPLDCDDHAQSLTSLRYGKFCSDLSMWVLEQLWENPELARGTKSVAKASVEKTVAKNNKEYKTNKKVTPEMIKEEWMETHGRNAVKLQKKKEHETDEFCTIILPNTEHVDFKRSCTRGLGKREIDQRKMRKEAGIPFKGSHPLYTAAYNEEKDFKMENPIIYRTACDGKQLTPAQVASRPMQHGDIFIPHYQPVIFDDSPKISNGTRYCPVEVHYVKFAKASQTESSEVVLEPGVGQAFPDALSEAQESADVGQHESVDHETASDYGGSALSEAMLQHDYESHTQQEA